MLAVFVNCISIILGSILGLLFSSKIKEELIENIQSAAGIVTIVLGLQMAFKYENIVFLSLSLIIGGVLGSVWNIDGKILAIGTFIQKILKKTSIKKTIPQENSSSENCVTSKNNETNFAYAFLNSSVLFCVGAMAIVGSFKAGIEKDYSIIFTKSILDGFMAISFAASMGFGTIFSALSVFLYQGLLTILAVIISPYVSDTMLNELTACGGAIIVMIGINLLNLKKIKTANFLPAIVFTIIFVLVSNIKFFY